MTETTTMAGSQIVITSDDIATAVKAALLAAYPQYATGYNVIIPLLLTVTATITPQ